MPEPTSRHSSLVSTALVTGLLLSVVLLAWLGLRVSREWQASAALLVQRRAEEAVSLFVMAVTRDMRAVQTEVLSNSAWQRSRSTPQDVTMVVASAFARYPYPEFFLAIDAEAPARLVFMRENRLPAWAERRDVAARFPVRVVAAPPSLEPMLRRIDGDAATGRAWSVFQMPLDGRAYQVVARLEYADPTAQHFTAAYGFAVDLDWARTRYFPELTAQMQRLSGVDTGLDLAIVDDRGAAVAATQPLPFDGHVSERPFPVLFMDPREVVLTPPGSLPDVRWKVLASAAADTALSGAIAGARWTSLLAATAAVMLVVGLALSVRALRASSRLAEMRAEFMTAITHDLKTPIASIRALAQNLATGRVSNGAHQREYGQLIDSEARRLARLVDNVLAHARITDLAEAYAFEDVDAGTLLHDAASRLGQAAEQAKVTLCVDVPADLPLVRADPRAMALVIDNLLDNAIRYSGHARTIRLSATRTGRVVTLTVTDDGAGIPSDDLPQVLRRGVRRHDAPPGGSGLGLAIVQRIVAGHSGRFTLDSVEGAGTTASVDVPATTAHSSAATAASVPRGTGGAL